jgi:hypothetical protein
LNPERYSLLFPTRNHLYNEFIEIKIQNQRIYIRQPPLLLGCVHFGGLDEFVPQREHWCAQEDGRCPDTENETSSMAAKAGRSNT